MCGLYFGGSVTNLLNMLPEMSCTSSSHLTDIFHVIGGSYGLPLRINDGFGVIFRTCWANVQNAAL